MTLNWVANTSMMLHAILNLPMNYNHKGDRGQSLYSPEGHFLLSYEQVHRYYLFLCSGNWEQPGDIGCQCFVKPVWTWPIYWHPITSWETDMEDIEVRRYTEHRWRNPGGAVGAVAPTKYKVWGHRPHDPTITYSHDSDKASPLY